MPITFECYACNKRLKVDQNKAGKKAKCIGCGTVVTIPMESTVPDSSVNLGYYQTPAHPISDSSIQPQNPPATQTPFPQTQTPMPPTNPQYPNQGFPQQGFPPQQPGTPQHQPAFPPQQLATPQHPGMPSQQQGVPAQQPPGQVVQPSYVQQVPGMPGQPGVPPGYQPGMTPPGGMNYDSGGYAGLGKSGFSTGSWFRAKVGLLLAFIANCVIAGSTGLFFVALILSTILTVRNANAPRPPSRDSFSNFRNWKKFEKERDAFNETNRGLGETSKVFYGISSIITLLAIAACTAGYVFMMLGPDRNGVLGLSITLVIIAGIEIILRMIYELPSWFSGATRFSLSFGNLVLIMWFIIQSFFITQLILFPLIQRGYCQTLRKRNHAARCLVPVFVGSAYGALRLILFIIIFLTHFRVISGTGTGGNVWMYTEMVIIWISTITFIPYIIILLRTTSKTLRFVSKAAAGV